MKEKYLKFIATIEHKHKNDSYGLRGKCRVVSEKMVSIFPELKLIRGHVLYTGCPKVGGIGDPHWWCVLKTDKGEEIIDPTISQFKLHPLLIEYIPWDESKELPTGKCPNCGDYCYNRKYLCSEKCEKEYETYLTGETK